MRPPVITFSVQLGADGTAIARTVSERLGYAYYDREVISRAAAAVGVSPATVADAERWPNLAERMLESLAQSATLSDGIFAPVAYDPALRMTSADYRRLIERVVQDLAQGGGRVIVGHAGQAILQEQGTRVFKILVRGSVERRAARLVGDEGRTPEDAHKDVEESDARRTEFFDHVYHLNWLDSSLYDLTLNTDAIARDDAIPCILAALGAPSS